MKNANRVILYEGAGWISDAKIDRQGNLGVCSGDGDAESPIKVAKSDLGAPGRVLNNANGDGNATVPTSLKVFDTGEHLIREMARVFARQDANPCEDIKSFPDEWEIPWTHDFWGTV